jgi:F-type H+-transporting ATPase subunit a
MDFKSILKTRRGRLGLIGVVLAMLVLCVVGVLPTLGVLQQGELPEISLAAEEIPLPFKVPLFGDHIPNTLPATWLTMAILLGIGLAYHRAHRREGRPSRFQVAVEAVIEGLFGFVENMAGENARLFFPVLATFFLFIAISNWCGILPGFGSVGVRVEHHGEEVLVPFLRSADAHLSTTLALALVSVVATHYYGFKVLGMSYSSRFLNFKAGSPKPDSSSVEQEGFQGAIQRFVQKFARGVETLVNGIVGLLEIMLESLKVLPFAFRLFGNIFAGEVLLFVVTYLFAFVFPIIFLGLEIFVGLIQALIFTMLSLVFMSVATAHHGPDESH